MKVTIVFQDDEFMQRKEKAINTVVDVCVSTASEYQLSDETYSLYPPSSHPPQNDSGE